jgi:hypothetical protein
MKVETLEVTQTGGAIERMSDMSLRLDIPGPGRVVGSFAERLALNFRRAALALRQGATPGAVVAYNRLFAPRDQALGTPASGNDLRPEWAALGMWSVATLVARAPLSLIDAEDWFFGGQPSLTNAFSKGSLVRAERELAPVDAVQLRDLLPYAIDPHGPGTRRSVIRDPSQEVIRSARRQQGIYYTPGDVADYMSSVVVKGGDERVLDPACGTGVFLLAAARRLDDSGQIGTTPARLYGVDVDALAIDGACFVLTAHVLASGPDSAPWRAWHTARLNLAERDALSLLIPQETLGRSVDTRLLARARSELRHNLADSETLPTATILPRTDWGDSLASLFPESVDGFAVVGNPPYAPLGERPDLGRLRDLAVLRGSTVSPSTNAFIPFVEFMWAATGDHRSSALVVPMSIAYNTTLPFRSLRRAIRNSGGQWSFRFFDRTPDSLFGDDIKQRTAVVVRDPASSFSVATTGITRWTSRQRHGLFERLPRPVNHGLADITLGVPKVGQAWELETVMRLRARTEQLAETLGVVERGRAAGLNLSISLGSTAYNHLAVYREGGAVEQRISAHHFKAQDPALADWAYAILSSTFVYWLWRVDGDGFHVPSSWALHLPFSWRPTAPDHELARLGRLAWEGALDQPVVAVNKGRRTVSYRAADSYVDAIDREVLRRFGLDQTLAVRLQRIRQEAIDVGRGNKRDN